MSGSLSHGLCLQLHTGPCWCSSAVAKAVERVPPFSVFYISELQQAEKQLSVKSNKTQDTILLAKRNQRPPSCDGKSVLSWPIIGLVPRIAHLWAELWLGTKHGPVTDLKPFTHSAPGWQDQFGLNTFKTMYIGSGSVYPSIVNQSKVLLHSFLSESPRSHDSAESLLQKTGDR